MTRAEAVDDSSVHFLSLSPEVRNIIYRFAIVEDGLIVIHQQSPPPQQPGLLQVSRQIRQEAIDIYYQENLFRWRLRNYNADRYIRWCQSSLSRYLANDELCFKIVEGSKWENILQWLEADYLDIAPSLAIDENEPYGHITAVSRLFEMAHNLRMLGLSWEQVKQQLETVRLALAAVDPMWR